MRADAELFKMQYSLERVYTLFVPSHWGYHIAHSSEYRIAPCVTLNYFDSLYGVDGGAHWLVKANLTGIYSMSMTREPLTEEKANIAADIFLSKFGAQCNLYMMAVYFGSYISDYKSQYSTQFDIQDILKQFRESFLPVWNKGIEAAPEKPVTDPDGPIGHDALMIWLRESMQRGDDVRSGYLYRSGTVTEEMIERACL